LRQYSLIITLLIIEHYFSLTPLPEILMTIMQ
jgi:hypothetical protein